MFARKPKTSDVQSSLQRFSDLQRETSSRAKHFKLALESLSVQEKKQLVGEYSFETFHLIDSLLLNLDLAVDSQGVLEAESALWTLEQLLCLAPELVGRGWQRNAIETILKRALLPRNLLAVRKIGIRLFLMWYQELAVYGNTTAELDSVLQSLLPHFPLLDGRQSERVIQAYCDRFGGAHSLGNGYSNGNGYRNGFEPGPIRATPIIPNSEDQQQLGVRERAQTLQIYLDKFLEYCYRETAKIEWEDNGMQLRCAKFLLDRVVALYVHQVFPDIEQNGVDVFAGWEGSMDSEGGQPLDTADPVVIARYWLIRWMVNVASATTMSEPPPGLLLYHQALFSSQKATNTLLTLMREAMQLPLACANVVHKVLHLIRTWLLQKEIPLFVESGHVSLESASLLMIHLLMSFFHSPYLVSSGDRLPSAISLTHNILQIVRDFSNPATGALSDPLPPTVWSELIRQLSHAVARCSSRSDAYGSATAGGFTSSLLSVCVFVRVIREVGMDERMWDDVWLVFRSGIWQQMTDQWSKVAENITRALVLNLFGVDLLQAENDASGPAEHSSTAKRLAAKMEAAASDNGSGSGGYPTSEADGDRAQDGSVSSDSVDMQSVVQSTGNAVDWFRTWMRVMNLVDPTDPRYSQLAVQTISRAVDTFLDSVGVAANGLCHWLCARLLRLNVVQQPHVVPALCAVLIRAEPPPLERAYILHHLLLCLQSEDISPIVLDQIPQMGIEEMAVLSSDTIETLQRLMRNSEFSSKAVRVAALLALNHPEAEKILISVMDNKSVDVDLPSLVLCVNALSILVLERVDAQLLNTLFDLTVRHPQAAQLLPTLCSNLGSATRLGFQAKLIESLEISVGRVREPRLLNDLKWHLCSLLLKEKTLKSWRPLIDGLAQGKDSFLEGLLTQRALQYPIPGFPITQWNSIDMTAQPDAAGARKSLEPDESVLYVDTEGAVISVDNNSKNQSCFWSRTVVGRHCLALEAEEVESSDEAPVNAWLRQLSQRPHAPPPSARRSPGGMSAVPDPLQDLPPVRAASAASTATELTQPIDATDMLAHIQRSTTDACRRRPMTSHSKENDEYEQKIFPPADKSAISWRQFASDFRLLDRIRAAPANYQRDVRHLDGTLSREVHKVAVIYVGPGQEDKQSVLSNSAGSDKFSAFVDGLGWPVQTGPNHLGYSGGLPAGQMAPYFATSSAELIFHVSTLIQGDVQQKWKHIGNDEVHVVWSEHSRPYRRDVIATRFCDVLVVLYPVSDSLVRVHVEAQNANLQFGPLFDGACVHIKQVPSLVRDTVLNASRAYRLEQHECERPNKHREKVFQQTKSRLEHMPLAESITRLYVPSLKS